MLDILLDGDGDMLIGEDGDIQLTESIRQAIAVRLKWFFGEWRFAPGYGVPYFDEVFVKNPNDNRIRQLIRDEALSVDGVLDIGDIEISVDAATRAAMVKFAATTDAETLEMEVLINA